MARDSSGGAAEFDYYFPGQLLLRSAVSIKLFVVLATVQLRVTTMLCLREGLSSTWLQEQFFCCGRSIVLFLLAKGML